MAEEVQREMNEGQERTMICSNDTQRARVTIIEVQLTLEFVLLSYLTVTKNFAYVHTCFNSIQRWYN